jgi:modification methylase
VVERGLLRPGEVLTCAKGHRAARVRADGTLVADGVTGSIHQVGAALEGAPSCNGWTYWHVKRDGVPMPIDVLRQQIRAEMGPHP